MVISMVINATSLIVSEKWSSTSNNWPLSQTTNKQINVIDGRVG